MKKTFQGYITKPCLEVIWMISLSYSTVRMYYIILCLKPFYLYIYIANCYILVLQNCQCLATYKLSNLVNKIRLPTKHEKNKQIFILTIKISIISISSTTLTYYSESLKVQMLKNRTKYKILQKQHGRKPSRSITNIFLSKSYYKTSNVYSTFYAS